MLKQNKRVATLGLSFVMLLLLSALSDASYAQAVLYKVGKVFTMTGDPLEPGQVLVVDGKITAVGQSLNFPSGTQVVESPELTLMPGLVDAYSHAGLAGGNDEYTKEVTPGFYAGQVIDWKDRALREAVELGTTTVNVAPGTENVIAGVASVVKTAGPQTSARVVQKEGALILSLCSDPRQRNSARSRPDGLYVRQPTNRMGVVWILRSTFDRVSRGLTVEGSEVMGESLTGQRRLLAVSRTSYDINSLLTLANEFNFSPIVVGGQEAHKIAERLAADDVPVILGSMTTGGLRGPEDTELCWNQAGVLNKAGVTFALSSGNLLEQARFAHRFGLDADQALRSITQTPAVLLGIEDRVGSLAAGLDADMVALEGDPLEVGTAIRWVMVNGTIIQQQ